MDPKNNKPLFTLSVTAEIIGVHPRTLMIYENEKLVIPFRTKTNRRRYSQNDVKKLQFIRYLTKKRGVNLAGVKCVFDVFEKVEDKDLDPQRITFPDFVDSTLI
ncbi:MAG: MerR family transcriptional regulator [Bacteroidetes bacterium]|nr:MerR family transcriptional regulator [Bacteroidota bacterium]